jgi:uncharacterized membrane protein required for colicin V production
VESIQPFDLVVFLGLFAMFIVGYAQGIVRRLFGIGAILFSLGLAAQLRAPLGGYLAQQWTTIIPQYSLMVAFLAVFIAAGVALSIAIQLYYRPAPLLTRYPVADEVLGGVLGVLQGLLILMAVLIILDPYFKGPGAQLGGSGEFAPLRALEGFIDDALSAQIMRNGFIPNVMAVLGWLFPRDVVETFSAIAAAVARI